MGFGFCKSCTKLFTHMAHNGGYPLRGRLINPFDGFSFGKSCSKLIDQMAHNGGYPLRGRFIVLMKNEK
jgi:hypothetical protein